MATQKVGNTHTQTRKCVQHTHMGEVFACVVWMAVFERFFWEGSEFGFGFGSDGRDEMGSDEIKNAYNFDFCIMLRFFCWLGLIQ